MKLETSESREKMRGARNIARLCTLRPIVNFRTPQRYKILLFDLVNTLSNTQFFEVGHTGNTLFDKLQCHIVYLYALYRKRMLQQYSSIMTAQHRRLTEVILRFTRSVLLPLRIFLLCSVLVHLSQVAARKIATKKKQHIISSRLNQNASSSTLFIHVVCHSHDDVGWLKTWKQYYDGHRNDSIDTRGNVRDILTTTVEALMQNPQRTFTVVEIKYFRTWWKEQSNVIQDQVRYLIANQQLTFVNGGWSMHDEASTHYMGMIDQTTLGHAFLKQELGVVPKIGWQLDPFGHSLFQAQLCDMLGFDALYFGRIDYQDLYQRQQTQQCEGLWKVNSKQKEQHLLWGLTGSYRGNYGPFPGFCFDTLCEDERLLNVDSTRLLQRVYQFLEYAAIQAQQTQGNHIMLTMGSDFHFSQAHVNYANIDLLISSTMNYQRNGKLNIRSIFGNHTYEHVEIFYSDPEYYTKMKWKEYEESQHNNYTNTSSNPIHWNVKTDDFFPYADGPHSYWTGYLTSRTAFKRFERVASSFLMAARQIQTLFMPFFCGKSSPPSSLFEPLEDALGVVQHHDAISGTAKQHVADDYSQELQAGLDQASSIIGHLLGNLTGDGTTTLYYCQRLNESICEVSESSLTGSNHTAIQVVIYNSLAIARSIIVRLPVLRQGSYTVESPAFSNITKCIDTYPALKLQKTDRVKHLLVFEVDVPAVGFIEIGIKQSSECKERKKVLFPSQKLLHIHNGIFNVSVNQDTGMIELISRDKVSTKFQQTWGYYKSFDSSIDHAGYSRSSQQNSGAYIFRPSKPDDAITQFRPTNKAKIFSTSVGTEIYSYFEVDWIRQATRIYDDKPFIEIEYTVGPVPINDGRGKEIISRYQTDIESRSSFFTDSNGRAFLQRIRNQRPSWNLTVHEPVAGNFYPVNAAIYLQDLNTSFSVVVDRSQAGSSLLDGSIDLMVQRRNLADDDRGVGEPLNETVGGMTPYPPYGSAVRLGEGVIIRGIHRLLLGGSNQGASLSRGVMDAAFAEPLVYAGLRQNPSSFLRHGRVAFPCSAAKALPPNAMLMTLQTLPRSNERVILLRIGHQFGVGEDPILSKPINIDLAEVFPSLDIKQVRETSMSGNQDIDDILRRKEKFGSDINTLHSRVGRRESGITMKGGNFSISLEPMEIKTFEMTLVESSTNMQSTENLC